MTKIAIEIQADGEFCGDCWFDYGSRLDVRDGKYKGTCVVFEELLDSKNGSSLRCRQCIDAEIGD